MLERLSWLDDPGCLESGDGEADEDDEDLYCPAPCASRPGREQKNPTFGLNWALVGYRCFDSPAAGVVAIRFDRLLKPRSV